MSKLWFLPDTNCLCLGFKSNVEESLSAPTRWAALNIETDHGQSDILRSSSRPTNQAVNFTMPQTSLMDGSLVVFPISGKPQKRKRSGQGLGPDFAAVQVDLMLRGAAVKGRQMHWWRVASLTAPLLPGCFLTCFRGLHCYLSSLSAG